MNQLKPSVCTVIPVMDLCEIVCDYDLGVELKTTINTVIPVMDLCEIVCDYDLGVELYMLKYYDGGPGEIYLFNSLSSLQTHFNNELAILQLKGWSIPSLDVFDEDFPYLGRSVMYLSRNRILSKNEIEATSNSDNHYLIDINSATIATQLNQLLPITKVSKQFENTQTYTVLNFYDNDDDTDDDFVGDVIKEYHDWS
jgi:hypothetical protein